VDSHLIPVVLTVAFILTLVAYGRWRARVNRGLAMFGDWVWGFVTDEKTCRVAETFCNEVAVLWFVFPLLDNLYDPNKRLSDPTLHGTFLIAGMFFLFAVVISHIAKGGKEH